ncbi:hypothetical protein N7451_000507 [Penicillium sp. IBT 35674x]|nr:hypothetical protein N7451_000507 [Penicillium sp. IBT 35674x]
MVSFKSVLGALAIAASVAPSQAIVVTIALDVSLSTIASCVGAIGTVGGTVASAVSASNSKRTEDEVKFGPISRVKRQSYGTKYDWEQCHSELSSSSVTFSAEGPGTIVVSGMPVACMDLATVITGKFDEGNPVPLSNNAIRFSGLTNDDINKIQDALDSRA